MVARGMPMEERIYRFVGPQQLWTGAKRFARSGRFGMANAGLRASAQLWSEDLGPKHPWVGSALGYLAWTDVKIGRLADAVTHYREALEIAGGVVEPNHARIETLRRDLGWAERALRGEDTEEPPGAPDRLG